MTSLKGMRRNLCAFGLGTLAVLALPPVFALPALIPSFCGLFLLVAAAPSLRRAFLDGWWWGWGYYMAGLYWLVIALLTDAEKFAWLIPFTLFGLTAIIALYSGAACWLAALTGRHGVAGIFVFSVLWILVEYARGHFFTGFPWNLAGYAFAFSDAALQPASLIGVYGLTWGAIWLATIPAALVHKDKNAARAIAASYFLFLGAVAWGQWRLHEADRMSESERSVPGIMLRLVQANIAQHHKWDPRLQLKGIEEHIRLTRLPGIERVTHIIWPETAVPYIIKADTPLVRLLGTALPPGRFLITGGLRSEGEGEDWRLWNSIVAIDHEGQITGSYDKFKLVPFGEFVPFRELIPAGWLTPVGSKDFSRGPGPQTVVWGGLPPVSPLVCYEAIFPELAIDRGQRPQWMLNVTNDAWFGMSSGPHQHLHMARLRSVEEGLPMIRVANTGITAAIDAYGRVTSKIGLGTAGILDVTLQKPNGNATVYSLYRDRFLWLLAGVGFILIFITKPSQRIH